MADNGRHRIQPSCRHVTGQIFDQNIFQIFERILDIAMVLFELFNVFLLEDDLGRHTLIENKVLVPFVMQLEKSHGR